MERLVPAGSDEANLQLRSQLRAERSQEVIGRIWDWSLGQHALPEGGLGKAIAYMRGMWPGLTRFLEDPRVPLDNNPAERSLRGVVVGRKNYYGSRSKRGTEVAALFYSLCESARLCGVEPKSYLLHATRAAIAEDGTATLPHTLLG